MAGPLASTALLSADSKVFRPRSLEYTVGKHPPNCVKEATMPTISMFYGIIISLYFFDDERHKLPHIHAKFQDQNASFSIGDGNVLAGTFPSTKTRLVQAWIEIHREELLADWELAVNCQPPFKIDPLR